MGQASRTGVLLLPPLAYEDTSAYRPLRVLADAVASAGHLVLRLDWPGQGDSQAEALSPQLHELRLGVVVEAAARLRAAGCQQVLGIAVRAGGLLALASGAFDALALWDCPATGRRYLREQKAFHRMAAASFGGGPAATPSPEGSIEAGGFLHGPEVVGALEAFDPKSAVRAVKRALLIGRDGAAPDAGLVEALRAGGAEVEVEQGQGMAVLLENAYHADLAAGVRERIVDWVGTPAELHEPDLDLAPSLVLDRGVERPWLERGGAGQLSGIVCEPQHGARPGMAWTVFLNAGGIRRCEPNRLWTLAARALAAQGRPSLRFDVRDVGDSDGSAEPHQDLEAMYAPTSIDDAVQAVDWARDQGAASVDVVGLCSGAFLGAQVSARRSIRRALLFNCLAFVWDEEARASSMTAHIRGSLFDARRWKRLLTGKIDARALARAIVNKGRLRLRALRTGEQADAVEALLTEIQARGTQLHLVYSEGDPAIAYLAGHVPADRQPPTTVLPGADHTVRPVALHSRVVDLILGPPV